MKPNFSSHPIIRRVFFFFSGAFHNEIKHLKLSQNKLNETKNKTESLIKEKWWSWNKKRKHRIRAKRALDILFCLLPFLLYYFSIRSGFWWGFMVWVRAILVQYSIYSMCFTIAFLLVLWRKKNGQRTRKVSSISGIRGKT